MLLSCVRGNRLGAATALRELWVQNNRIRDLTAAANALKGLPQLQKLDVWENSIGDEGAKALAANLHFVPQLRVELLDWHG